MKTQSMYTVLSLTTNQCYQIGHRERVEVSLPALLEDGWRPVRETAIAGGWTLLVLERDGGASSGFGFGPP